MLGFDSPTMLKVLKDAREWFVGGTWDIVSQTFFTQAWVIVANLDLGNSLPAACILS